MKTQYQTKTQSYENMYKSMDLKFPNFNHQLIEQDQQIYQSNLDFQNYSQNVIDFVLEKFSNQFCRAHNQKIDMIFKNYDSKEPLEKNLICSSCILQKVIFLKKEFYNKHHKNDVSYLNDYLQIKISEIFGIDLRRQIQNNLDQKQNLQNSLKNKNEQSLIEINDFFDNLIKQLIIFKDEIYKKCEKELTNQQNLINNKLSNIEKDIEQSLKEHDKFMTGNIHNFFESIKNFEHPDQQKELDFIIKQLIKPRAPYPSYSLQNSTEIILRQLQDQILNQSLDLNYQSQLQSQIITQLKECFDKNLLIKEYDSKLLIRPNQIKKANKSQVQITSLDVSQLNCKGYPGQLLCFKDYVLSSSVGDQSCFISLINQDSSLSQIGQVSWGEGGLAFALYNKNLKSWLLKAGWTQNIIQIWNFDNIKNVYLINQIQSIQNIFQMEILNDIIIVFGKQGHILIYQIQIQNDDLTLNLISELKQEIYVCSVNVRENQIAIGSKKGIIFLFKFQENQILFQQQFDQKNNYKVSSVHLTDQFLVTGSLNGLIIIHDLNNQNQQKLNIFNNCVYSFIQIDEKNLIVSSWDGKVLILDIQNQFCIKAQVYHKLKNNKINHVNNKGIAVFSHSQNKKVLFSNGNEDKKIQGFLIEIQN